MSDMLKKSEKINTSDTYVKSDNLNEQWKKGELPEGMYYFKLPNGETMAGTDYCLATYLLTKDSNRCEVLAEVPSYEEWQRIFHYASKYEHEYTSCAMDYENLKEENAQLKELLKECVEVLNDAQRNYGYDDSILDICSPTITKINQVLGEDK